MSECCDCKATIEMLRAKLAACESEIDVLRRYGNKLCTAMADEYMRSDEYLASRAAPDPGPIHPWDAVGVYPQPEPPRP